MDETSTQLIGEVREPLSLQPGHPTKYDTEYQRNGTANIFIAVEPLAGTRVTKVTDQRTKRDWADYIKDLVDDYYPGAQEIHLVMDNLNTHTKASLYETFEPKEARRIADKLAIHYTPKHGSWLNIAEIELSHLSRQCLDRRIANKARLTKEVRAWNTTRNNSKMKVHWQFTTEDARIKLHKLYPILSN